MPVDQLCAALHPLLEHPGVRLLRGIGEVHPAGVSRPLQRSRRSSARHTARISRSTGSTWRRFSVSSSPPIMVCTARRTCRRHRPRVAAADSRFRSPSRTTPSCRSTPRLCCSIGTRRPERPARPGPQRLPGTVGRGPGAPLLERGLAPRADGLPGRQWRGQVSTYNEVVREAPRSEGWTLSFY